MTEEIIKGNSPTSAHTYHHVTSLMANKLRHFYAELWKDRKDINLTLGRLKVLVCASVRGACLSVSVIT